ncbi:glutamate receptor ionotropic, delta-1-like [Stegodyphus dumicola]|uniref:glutamate receptor ionotropic, delta-1-like n=1 Tax=Stegodyphus dumicola TaxID=202533 RepID=UPI0015A90551|nr:glutamate receptor ionotropic, delta-1-like [Stegodyphus dumicola]
MKLPQYLTVAPKTYSPYVEVDENENGELMLSGIEGKFLDLVLKSIGLPYKIVMPPDKEWGSRLPNGSWSGIIGRVQRGEADIGISAAITEQRLAVVDFSTPYSIESITFASYMPGELSSLYAYIYPFTQGVWACFFCLLFILPLLLMLILDRKYSYLYLFLQTAASILKQPFFIKENSTRGRILLIFLLFFTTIITLCYNCVLSAFLTIPLHKPPIRTFHDLYEVVTSGTHRCIAWEGSAMTEVLKLSSQPKIRELAKIIERENWTATTEAIRSPEIFNKDSAVMISEFEYKVYFGMRHKITFYLMDEVLASSKSGLVLRKDFCCKEHLNAVISRLISGGFYYKLMREESYMNWLKSSHRQEMNDNHQPMHEIITFLIVFATGSTLAFFVLLGEILWARLHKTEEFALCRKNSPTPKVSNNLTENVF